MSIMSQLGNICDITPGFPFRGRVESDISGSFRVIQMKDIEQGYTGVRLKHETMTVTNNHGFQVRHFAQKNDVILCSRGNSNFCLLLIDFPENTIVSAQFLILRCSFEKLLPGYLFWFLNNTKSQKLLSGIRRGTTTQMVTTDALSAIEISVPDIETQKLTAEVYRLQMREKELLCTIQQKQDELIETRLLQKAEGIEK